MSTLTRQVPLLAQVILILIGAELAVMAALPHITRGLPHSLETLADALLLGLIAGPLIAWRLHAARAPGSAADAIPERRSVPVITTLVLLVGLALSLVAAWVMHEGVRSDTQARFERASDRALAALVQRASTPAYGLRGMRGLYKASEQVTRAEFSAFIRSRDLPGEFPGVRGFGFIERVPREALDAFVTREREEMPNFTVRGDTTADTLYIVRYIVPYLSNTGEQGVNLGSIDAVRAAIERSAGSGELTLADNAGSGARHPLLMLPVYRNDSDITTPETRKRNLVGLLYARVNYAAWLGNLDGVEDGMLSLVISDPARHYAPVLSLGHAPASQRGNEAWRPSRVERVRIGGREWVVTLRATPRMEPDVSLPVLVGIGGTLLSVLLASLVWSMGRSRERALAIAGQMTADLSMEKRRVEAAHTDAQAARDQMQAFIDCAPVAIFVVGTNGRIRYANRGIGRFARTDLPGSRLVDIVTPERRGALEAAIQGVESGGGHATLDLSLPTNEGQWLQYACHIGPMRHEGQITGTIVTAQDVSDERRVQSELSAAQRLATVGSLAAGIAHEINTPIQFIGDSVHFLRDASSDVFALVDSLGALLDAVRADADAAVVAAAAEAATSAREAADLDYLREHVPKAFERSLDGLERVATIVRSMKEFSHPAQKEKAAADLNRAIQSTLTVGRNEYKYVADLETDFGELPPVLCHLNDINQVVLNIVVNAAHAIGDAVAGTERRGRISLSTRQEGDHAVIRIADTGKGIPEHARPRIFDPFFTTKEVGKGTGQGLAIAWAIVHDKHGGDITFTTETGVGTTFVIRLPLGDAPGGHAMPAGSAMATA